MVSTFVVIRMAFSNVKITYKFFVVALKLVNLCNFKNKKI